MAIPKYLFLCVLFYGSRVYQEHWENDHGKNLLRRGCLPVTFSRGEDFISRNDGREHFEWWVLLALIYESNIRISLPELRDNWKLLLLCHPVLRKTALEALIDYFRTFYVVTKEVGVTLLEVLILLLL